ncbi:MAG: phage major capsid protein [Methylocystis sp.]|uniref:phage major capsid protein n=1 Tax=Methylocystis sp. TaxID=1911079 RepID=UPI003DA3ED46
MTETKHLDLDLELKFATGQETGAFEGLAAGYGNVDRGGDILAPGAFAESLAQHKAAGTMPALLWQHDATQPIGVVDSLAETPMGLRIKGRLALDTIKGAEARSLAQMGALQGLSIGYRAIKATRDARGVRTITAAYLGEISFVTVPMNERAKITNVKAAGAAKEHTMDDENNGAAAGNADIEKKLAELESKTAKIDDLENELKAANKRADALELKMQRPGAQQVKDTREDLEKKAFTAFLRKGREALGADEVKSLQVANDTLGGYLAPADFSAEVDKNLVQFSPVRAAARVGATASGSVIIPRRTGAPTASWVGETDTRSATASAYGQVEIPIDELACYVDVSNRLLEDAAVNIAAEVAFDLAEEFGRAEGAAFVSGTGVKQPLGFMSDTNVLSTNSGAASSITADGMIDLFYALNPAYRMRGVWMANGTTLAALRKLKDGDGQYLWQPGLQAGQPDMFLGRPLIEAVDMPSISAGTYPVCFGDFASAYRIYDRVNISLLRDPYSVATSGLTRFHARRRVGGGVVRAEAIRKLKISA